MRQEAKREISRTIIGRLFGPDEHKGISIATFETRNETPSFYELAMEFLPKTEDAEYDPPNGRDKQSIRNIKTGSVYHFHWLTTYDPQDPSKITLYENKLEGKAYGKPKITTLQKEGFKSQ